MSNAPQNSKKDAPIEVAMPDIVKFIRQLGHDPRALQPALIELFANAFRHDRGDGPILVEARTEDDQFVFVIREPKRNFDRSTKNWGREPLRTITQGHYGLGLHRSRAILEAHEGQLSTRYDKGTSSLITKITLPLSNKRA